MERHFDEEKESKKNGEKAHEILSPNTVFGMWITQRPLPPVWLSGTGVLANRTQRDHAPADQPAHGRREQHRADRPDPENKRKEGKTSFNGHPESQCRDPDAGGGEVMFEKFGELNSCEEINELAENLFNEGDFESLRAMAQENGIEKELTDLYINGDLPELCDPMTAAIGKLEIECQNLKPKEIMEDWVEYIRGECMESEEVASAVRWKGKSLKGCITELLKWSFKNQQTVDKDIVKAAGVNARVTLGIPGMGRAKKIIREYYLGGEAK